MATVSVKSLSAVVWWNCTRVKWLNFQLAETVSQPFRFNYTPEVHFSSTTSSTQRQTDRGVI